ncbi:MAG: O-antigen ligase family protein [Acidobacteria bacterium]|nr:O-antigen ligase family protein [Acidobacteriota bacterium]
MVEVASRIRQAPENAIVLVRPKAEGFAESAAMMLDRTIFSLLLVMIAVLAMPYGAVEAWWESIFECTVFVLTALWIVEGLLRGSWRVGDVRLFAPLLALGAFAWLQTRSWQGATMEAGIQSQDWAAISADPYETQRFVLRLLALVLTGALLQSHVYNRRRLVSLINIVIFTGVASAIFGILRQTAQHEDGFLLAYLRPGEGYGQFINRNHFAFLMEMALGLALGLVVGKGARRDRSLVYIAAIIPLWTALVLSNSRGGIGSLLSQMLFMTLMLGFVRGASESNESYGFSSRLVRIGQTVVARFAIVGCLVAVLGVGIIWMGGDPLANRLETLPTDIRAASPDERASQSRVEIWLATWRLIQAHPILGTGFAAYGVAIPEYHDSSGEITPQQAHNDYLELLASGGMIAGLIGLWFVTVLIKRIRRELQSAEAFRRSACFGAVLGIFGVATHSLVDFGLHITTNAIVFIALVVIATLDWRAMEWVPLEDRLR